MSPVDAQPVKPSQKSPHSLLSGPGGRSLIRTWFRLALFLLPICVLVILPVYYVDPFRLFDKPSVVPESVRSTYAPQVNQVLWKIPAYSRDPAADILLGDSQMARLPDQVITGLTGQKYANLAYGGGTLRESISTFWFASQRVSLRKVFFGVSFMEYNAYPLNRVIQTEEVVREPAFYFLKSDVLETTAYDVGEAFFDHHTNLLPQVSKDSYWVSQLQSLAKRYDRESPPGILKGEIRKIVDYCHAHQISIVFVVPPQHMEAQRRIEELGFEDEYTHFKSDLISMAPVYDCDIESDLTRDKSNYADPFHLANNAATRLAEDIWSGNPQWCQVRGVN
jgi:hypothetical protein